MEGTRDEEEDALAFGQESHLPPLLNMGADFTTTTTEKGELFVAYGQNNKRETVHFFSRRRRWRAKADIEDRCLCTCTAEGCILSVMAQATKNIKRLQTSKRKRIPIQRVLKHTLHCSETNGQDDFGHVWKGEKAVTIANGWTYSSGKKKKKTTLPEKRGA